MLILAIDTSSTSGSIALVSDKGLVAEWTVGDVGTHADWLLKNIFDLLKSVKRAITEVDLFAVSIGPGSFTGLRIGVTTIKGLAWAQGKKVIGVSTLKALAMNFRYSSMAVCPILDARKGEVYSALFRFTEGRLEEAVKEQAIPPKELFNTIFAVNPLPAVFTGSGLKAYLDAVKENAGHAVIAPEPLWHLRASNIALLAMENPDKAVSPGELTPVYLRKSEAEIKRVLHP